MRSCVEPDFVPLPTMSEPTTWPGTCSQCQGVAACSSCINSSSTFWPQDNRDRRRLLGITILRILIRERQRGPRRGQTARRLQRPKEPSPLNALPNWSSGPPAAFRNPSSPTTTASGGRPCTNTCGSRPLLGSPRGVPRSQPSSEKQVDGILHYRLLDNGSRSR